MGVVEVLEAAGSFSINMNTNMPRSIIETTMDYFGHIAIVPGRVNPQALGDNMLTAARYVGVLRKKAVGDQIVIDGGGMILWLGDQDDKGSVFENATIFSSAGFATVIRGLLPPEITEGTLYPVPGLLTKTFQWQSPRTAIQFTCDTMFAEFRVNNNGTLDAGPVSSLYVTTPKCIIVRNNSGQDMRLAGLPGSLESTRDVEDFTTRVVLLAQGTGITIGVGHADINPTLNQYKDIHGNTLKRTRLVSESGTPLGLAGTRAQLQLNRYTALNNAISLKAIGSEYDIKGEFNVGDTVWVYDPDSGLYDTANEVTFRGQRINPVALRVIEADWPILQGMTVAYRDKNGVWTDLTDYVQWETGDVTVVVGNVNRTLLQPTTGYQPIGSRPDADTVFPGTPTFITPFASAAYLDGKGFTRAKMSVKWSAPLNTDGSTINDGDHYEIRYAVDASAIYPSTWQNVSTIRWQDMQTWGQPFVYPDGGLWNLAYSPWLDTSIIISDLSPGVGYDFQIRAVDVSGNQGAWSATTTAVTLQDNIPPSAPAPPTVASSRIAVQITHTLGKSSGGTFNLENDIDHLNVHVGTGADFYPDDSTCVGKLKANGGMLASQTAAVGTFNVESTIGVWVKVIAVDIAGNKSVASSSVQATALLIDDQHISNLTVSKVTAGTISADWIVGARIKTADSGARVEMSAAGIAAFNNAGTQTVKVASADGSVAIVGQLSSGSLASGDSVVINPAGSNFPQIRFYPSTGSNYARISSFTSGMVNPPIVSSQAAPGEAVFILQSGVSADNTAASFYKQVSTFVELIIMDPTGTNINGGMVQLGQNRMLSGFYNGTSQNYFFIDPSGINYLGTNAFNVDWGAGQGWITISIVNPGPLIGVSTSFSTKSSAISFFATIYDGLYNGYAYGMNTQTTSAVGVKLSASSASNFTTNFWGLRT